MVIASARSAVLLALLTLLALPHTAQAVTWSACADFTVVRCATVTVPLDRTGADPGQVALRVGRIGKPSGKTLMYLSGGPGGAGVSEMVNVIPIVPSLMRRYRVIGYDQRGTGRSGLLRCPALERDPHLRNTAAAAQCADVLGVARRHYTTADSVQDMEAIRQQLGVDKLTLFGISYGTELALAYARTFPAHVDRLIIDSVVDPDDADPFVTASFRAMTPTLDALCPRRCRGISIDPASDLYELVKRLHTREMHSLAYDAGGRPHKVTIGPTVLMDLMFNADYDPPLRAALPAAVRSALGGDAAPLARLVREGDVFNDLGPAREFSTARYATICEETPLPWDSGNAVRAAPGGRARADRRARPGRLHAVQRRRRVPRRDRPVPALAGCPATPVGRRAAAVSRRADADPARRGGPAHAAGGLRPDRGQDPGSKRLVVPGVGHAVTGADPSGCGERAIVRFVSGGAVPSTCRRVPTFVPGVLYGPASFESLPGFGRQPRRIGRTLRALEATFDDLRVVTSPAVLANSGGGLRGGSLGGARAPLQRARLHRGARRDAHRRRHRAPRVPRRRLEGGARDGHAALGRPPAGDAGRPQDRGHAGHVGACREDPGAGRAARALTRHRRGSQRFRCALCTENTRSPGDPSDPRPSVLCMSNQDPAKARDTALQGALSQIEKQFGKGSVMRMGDPGAQVKVEAIPTGALSLDLALGIGGVPRGRIVEVFGPESSGKTTLIYHMIAEAQKLGGVCAFIDAEHAMDPLYAQQIGVNIDELLVSQPDYGEQALEIADMLVRSGAVDVVAVDSVAALTPRVELEGQMGDQTRRRAGADDVARRCASWPAT